MTHGVGYQHHLVLMTVCSMWAEQFAGVSVQKGWGRPDVARLSEALAVAGPVMVLGALPDESIVGQLGAPYPELYLELATALGQNDHVPQEPPEVRRRLSLAAWVYFRTWGRVPANEAEWQCAAYVEGYHSHCKEQILQMAREQAARVGML